MTRFFRTITTGCHDGKLYFVISLRKIVNPYRGAVAQFGHLSRKELTLRVNDEAIETGPIECTKESLMQFRDKLPGLINDEEMVSELQPALTFVAGLY